MNTLLFYFVIILLSSTYCYSEGKGTYSYIDDSKKDLISLLSHSVFKKYKTYTIENIRHGELGEAQAFFVRLVSPFKDSSKGLCLTFRGTEELVGKARSCKKAE